MARLPGLGWKLAGEVVAFNIRVGMAWLGRAFSWLDPLRCLPDNRKAPGSCRPGDGAIQRRRPKGGDAAASGRLGRKTPGIGRLRPAKPRLAADEGRASGRPPVIGLRSREVYPRRLRVAPAFLLQPGAVRSSGRGERLLSRLHHSKEKHR
jgi:hypothetical protein